MIMLHALARFLSGMYIVHQQLTFYVMVWFSYSCKICCRQPVHRNWSIFHVTDSWEVCEIVWNMWVCETCRRPTRWRCRWHRRSSSWFRQITTALTLWGRLARLSRPSGSNWCFMPRNAWSWSWRLQTGSKQLSRCLSVCLSVCVHSPVTDTVDSLLCWNFPKSIPIHRFLSLRLSY